MTADLERRVRRRAKDRCEYCRVPQSASRLRHQIDHIVARHHDGETTSDNLALCCVPCNLYKGTNIAGIDPTTGKLTRLFHPRRDRWQEHFAWLGPVLQGSTAVGRTTIRVLVLNSPDRVAAREALIEEGIFPPR